MLPRQTDRPPDDQNPEVHGEGVRPGHIRVRGFRTIRQTDLRVGPVTALVGEASVGKSNILAAISLMNDTTQPPGLAADMTTGMDVLAIDAVTSAGEAKRRFDRHGAWLAEGTLPSILLPSELRANEVVVPPDARETDPAVVAVASALRAQVAGARSPSAQAMGLVAAIEKCCAARVSGALLLIEEPELYLRPQAQRYLYRLLHEFARSGNQVIYTTTAPAFLNVARLDELAVVARHAETGTSVRQAPALGAPEGFRAMSEFDAERGELFLADVAVLVEGRTEKLALPHVFRLRGIDVDQLGVSIVECGGKANLPLFVKLCQATGVPFLVVHDRDARASRAPIPSERKLNDVLRQLAGDDRVIELVPDFEGVAGLRHHRHKPEQAWRHFRNLDHSDIPGALNRLVDTVVAQLDPESHLERDSGT